MSITLNENTIYLKDESTGTLKPVGLFGSGANESMTAIKKYADDTFAETKRKMDAVIPQDVAEVNQALTVQKDALDALNAFCSDIVLSENNVLYPIYTEVGDPVTIKTSDGSKFETGRLFFYDENKQNITGDGWGLSNNQTSRSITISFTKGTYAKYCSVTNQNVPIVLVGSIKQVNKTITDIKTDIDEKIDTVNVSVNGGSKTFTWEQGGIYNGSPTTDGARIRTSDFLIMPDMVTIEAPAGFKSLIYVYDKDMKYVYVAGWSTTPIVVRKESNYVYFKLALARTNDSALTPSLGDGVKVYYKHDDVGGKVLELENEFHRTYAYTYYGEKVDSKQGYNSNRIFTVSYPSSGTLNSIEVYGNNVICYINGANSLRVYDKSTKALLHDMSINLGHANSMSLGNKYDDSDALPLLYVEKEDSYGTYNVVRVSSDWTASIIKTYTFAEETYGHYPQVTWDFENGICYSIGIDNANNCSVFCKSNLNNEISNSNNTYTPALLFTSKIQKFDYIQDTKYLNGKIYAAHSSTMSSSAKSHVLVIDTSNGSVVTRIPTPFNGEIEGLAVYFNDDGELRMIVTDYYNFYELSF